MSYNFFLLPFLMSFSLGFVLLCFILWITKFFQFSECRRSARHIHKESISRMGGVAIIVSFILTLLFNRHLVISSDILAIIIASAFILLIGVKDDIKPLTWRTQFYLQLGVVVFVLAMGIKLEYITNPLGGIIMLNNGWGYIFGILVVIGWIIFLMNSMNWLDGIDGASGGISSIAALTIFFLSLRPEVNQPPIAIITASLAGCLFAFLIFNFYPARIMAGTSGSIFMGFILAILAIFAGAKIATTVLVLSIPIIDALLVILLRIKGGQSIFSADHRHLHFRLLELGWSQPKICAFYYGLTALISLIALNAATNGKIALFIFIALGLISTLVFIIKTQNAKQTK